MAKQYYDQPITSLTDWGGDSSTGNLQVKGSRVQEFIKGQLYNLEESDVEAEKKNPSVFGGFVDNVSLKNTDAGSDYLKVVFDVSRHTFFAVTMDGDVEKYHRLYDQFAVYNDGTWPNSYPYSGKVYVYGSKVYLWDGTTLVDNTAIATEEAVRSIVTNYNSSASANDEE